MLLEETFIILLRADIDFSSEERLMIDEAIDEWYHFTNGRFLFHIEYDLEKLDLDAAIKDDLIFRVDSDFYHIRQNDRKGIYTFGLCFNRERTGIMYIAIDRLPNRHLFKTTVMHELGHYLGLCHTVKKESIMYAYANEQTKFSQYDAAELCDKYGCSMHELRY